MDEIEIGFDEIKEGDEIRTVREDGNVISTVQGIAESQDLDGDWYCQDTLLTYTNSGENERYFLLSSGSLPTEAGTLVRWTSTRGTPVYSLKAFGEDGWFTTFSDGSSTFLTDLRVARKKWEQVA